MNLSKKPLAARTLLFTGTKSECFFIKISAFSGQWNKEKLFHFQCASKAITIYNLCIQSTIKMLKICLSFTQHTKVHFFPIFMCFFSFFFLFFPYIPSWAVSSVNSSKVTHSLWLISLCLSWILLPVFEALQWADDCLGRDYYTNLSTLLCQALSPGRLCVSVCVFQGFITLSLHKRKCQLGCFSMSIHLCTYMCLYMYVIMCVSSITVIFFTTASLLFLPFVTIPGLLDFITEMTIWL